MKKSKFSETQIVSILKQGDAGVPVKDLWRQAGISSSTRAVDTRDRAQPPLRRSGLSPVVRAGLRH